MNRFDRITAIFIQLQSKRIVTAQEMADRFEVSLRTIYRDIRSLEEAGLPIVSEAGVGYSLMDGYRLPPIMFTKEEALTFITAEKLMDRFTDYSLNKDYKAAMYKIRAVLRSAEKNYVEEVEKQIAVLPNSYMPENNKIPLQLILKSINEKTVLHIDYFANHTQQQSERFVEPVGVFHLGDQWHLIAYCQLRKDYRDFRLDRITQIQVTSKSFQKNHPPLQNFLDQFVQERALVDIVIRIPKEHYRHLSDQKYYHGFVSQIIHENVVEANFLSCSVEGFARWFMVFGDVAEIVKPESLKNKVREIAENILKKS